MFSPTGSDHAYIGSSKSKWGTYKTEWLPDNIVFIYLMCDPERQSGH